LAFKLEGKKDRANSSQAPVEAELMYWLPPSRVKQSGKATTTGGMRSSPISRSRRSGRFSSRAEAARAGNPVAGTGPRRGSRGIGQPRAPDHAPDPAVAPAGNDALAVVVREQQDQAQQWQRLDGAIIQAAAKPPARRNTAAEAALRAQPAAGRCSPRVRT
jgi:hypothetical protein